MGRFNVYHRNDGRWEGRIPLGTTDEGKRVFKYFFGKTKEDTIEKMAADQQNVSYADCRFSVYDLFYDWMESIKYKIKESTAANYLTKATKHILPAFGSLTATAINAANINKFIDEKKKNGLSNRYISDILIVMKSMFKYAVRKYRIYNPMDDIDLPSDDSNEIQLLDSDEQKKLQEYIRNNHNRSSLGVAISMATGIRIGELCALQWKDIDLKKRILTVSKTLQRVRSSNANKKTKLIITEPKSKSSRRKIPISSDLADFLQEYHGEPEEYVISGKNKPIEPRTMQYRFAKILKKAELPQVHFHALRHIFASTCIELGFDVKALSELLGHSKTEITLNRYVHSNFPQKIKYMERLVFDF